MENARFAKCSSFGVKKISWKQRSRLRRQAVKVVKQGRLDLLTTS